MRRLRQDMVSFRLYAVFITVLLVSSAVVAEDEGDYFRERRIMVDSQIAARGIRDKRILDVVGRLERHKFVPEGMREYAYEDISLPIGGGEAVPPAYFVSLAAQSAGLEGGEKVLELGIESGYQAAVFADLSREVYCVEPSEKITFQAGRRLEALGYKNIKVKTGEIESGWPEFAPYDVIVITNPMDFAPKLLVDQLMINGRIIMPLREYSGKKLIVLTKKPSSRRPGDGYELTATLVTPVLGEPPSGKETKEGLSDKNEASKWKSVKGGKWMKRK